MSDSRQSGAPVASVPWAIADEPKTAAAAAPAATARAAPAPAPLPPAPAAPAPAAPAPAAVAARPAPTPPAAAQAAAEQPAAAPPAPAAPGAESLTGTLFKACARILERVGEIEKKVRIGRDRLVADLKQVHAPLWRIVESMKENPAMAPGGDCKDLASNGYLLHRAMKTAISEEEHQEYQRTLVGGMSARRLVFEIEDAKDKEAIRAGFEKAAADLQTVMDRLVPPKAAGAKGTAAKPGMRR